MAAVAAVGLAASIAQLAVLGVHIVEHINELQANCKKLPEDYKQLHVELPLWSQIFTQTEHEIRTGSVLYDLGTQLDSVISGCKSQIDRPDDILKDVVPTYDDSRAQRVRKYCLSLQKSSEVADIHSRLTTYLATINLYFAWASRRCKGEKNCQTCRNLLTQEKFRIVCTDCKRSYSL